MYVTYIHTLLRSSKIYYILIYYIYTYTHWMFFLRSFIDMKILRCYLHIIVTSELFDYVLFNCTIYLIFIQY